MTTPFTLLTEPPSAGDEEFLYHLYRGSDLLQDGKIGDAKEALERALSFQPKDARGQDLLACVYFRLGVYPRAIEIYRRLVAEHPREPVLRVNLAVVFLKTGQPEAALAELKAAIDVQPDHPKANSYLGLVYQRLGDHVRAKEAYLRAGLVHMARRMGTLVEAETGGRSADDAIREEHRRKDVGSVADRAFQEIDSEDNPFLLEAERTAPAPKAAWTATEPGGEAVRPQPRVEPISIPPPAPTPRAGIVADLGPVGTTGISVEPGGALVLQLAGTIHARTTPLVLFEGTLAFEPARRRSKGRERDEPFGEGEAQVSLVRGSGRIVLAPAGASHYVVRVDDETLYVREERVAAFTDDLSWENGQVATPGGALRLASFRGRGQVALRVEGDLRRVTVRPQEGVSVDPAAVAGWMGRLLPRAVPRPGETDLGMLHFAGAGALLVVLAGR